MKAFLKRIVCILLLLAALTFLQGTLTVLHEASAKILKSYNVFLNKTVTSTTEAAVSIPDRSQLYVKRRNLIKDVCRQLSNTALSGFDNDNGVVDKIHFIYYCPITKVSSTFWKRVLTVLSSQGKLNSPFNISLGGVKLSKPSELSQQETNLLRKSGNSFMFVRDPYARLFSGYENKIYHANLMFWKMVGRQVVHGVRNDHDDVYKNYGFDVTFPEFVRYILYRQDSGQNIDGHFTPMFKSCNPCSTKFKYIGKMETFTDDTNYLISRWKDEFRDFSLQFGDFEKETILDTAKGHVRFLFETKKILDEIKFPFIKIMIRTWRDLQIRGYLSKYIEFPYKETDTELITKEEYFEAIKKALSIPVNRTEVKQQRDEALTQAYSQVPIEDMERLRKYVLIDCLLFGYDDRPKKLFDRSLNTKSDFTYLEGLSNN